MTKKGISSWNIKPHNGPQHLTAKNGQNDKSYKQLTCNNGRTYTSRKQSQLNVLLKQHSSVSPSNQTKLGAVGKVLIEKLITLYPTIKSTLNGFSQGAGIAIKQSWWCFPMILILYPVIALINGSYAKTPSWWSMCSLTHLHNTRVGHWICFGFLTSNIFYFLAGLYLLRGIPLSSLKLPLQSKGLTQRWKMNIHYPLLGWLVLCSGGISLLYHSFQALGAINIAESLCYIDHGLAISSGCCFFDKCGMPSSKTLLIGLMSLSMLSIGGDVYPIIHSFWHFGSASTTISWALDGLMRRKKFIIDTLHERRRLKQSRVWTGQ